MDKEKRVPHVIEEGSREHVISYHLINGKAVIRCSEPNCEENKSEDDNG